MSGRREQLAMSDDEVTALLDEGRRVHVATINADGTPHLVPLSYAMFDGRLTLWTDPGSKKVANLRRDPRVTCVVEEGSGFHDFRAVQLSGRAELVDDLATSERMGIVLFERYSPGPMTDAMRASATALAPQRLMIAIIPQRVVSWDHRKVAGVRPTEIGR